MAGLISRTRDECNESSAVFVVPYRDDCIDLLTASTFLSSTPSTGQFRRIEFLRTTGRKCARSSQPSAETSASTRLDHDLVESRCFQRSALNHHSVSET